MSSLGPPAALALEWIVAPDADSFGSSFLLKMFCETKMTVEPSAQRNPTAFARRSNEQASMTPSVSGTRAVYVDGEYRTRNSAAYERTVNSGERACGSQRSASRHAGRATLDGNAP